MVNRRLPYRLSPKAESDLENIWRYSAEHWSSEQAERYVSEIFAVCRDLAGGVRKGRTVPVRSDYLKYPAGSHFVYFRFRDGQLDIVRILHQHMDVERYL